MGALNRGVLVAEGLRLANESTALSTRANFWLNAWLRSTYAATPWPFLIQRKADLSLPTGTTSLSVGSGGSSITQDIQRVFAPVYLYDTAKTFQGTARIKQRLSGPASEDESAFNTTTKRGMPAEFKMRAPAYAAGVDSYGKWELWPNPVPEKDYLIAFDYQVIPDDLAADGDTPIYPNDRTMIQAVAVEALHYDADERYIQELEVLRSMTLDDRLRYGGVPGTNDVHQLDSSVFR